MIETSATTRSSLEKLPLMKQKLFKQEEWPQQGSETDFFLFIEQFRFIHVPTRRRVSSSITDEIHNVLGSLESQGVFLRDRLEVWEYLWDFPGLLNVLSEAVQAVRKHFGASQLILSVYHDPEIEDRYLQLCVRLKSYDESVLKRLEAAEAEFIDRLAHEQGWLQLTTDFEEPENAL